MYAGFIKMLNAIVNSLNLPSCSEVVGSKKFEQQNNNNMHNK